jgi:bifunctional non-homologous end joining protein LigD
VRLWSRNGRDWSVEFAVITHALRQLPDDVVLDGEAVAHCDEGLPDFNALLGRHGCARAVLFAFDLLMVGRDDLRPLPLSIRKEALAAALQSPPAAIRCVEHLDGQHGPAAFSAACMMGLEGIVSKRVESRYRSGRCASWRKVRNPAYERR